MNDRRPTRFQPFKKDTVRSISDSKPDDHRPNVRSCGPLGKVLVFCDDDGIDANCMIPDHEVFGTGETDIIDVLGVLGRSATEPIREAVGHRPGNSLRDHDHRVIDLGGGVFERRSNIVTFKVGKIGEYLCFRSTAGGRAEFVFIAQHSLPNAHRALSDLRLWEQQADAFPKTIETVKS